jgi:hypothetical protein
MVTLIGADYSAGRPGGAALAAAGVKVVGRYASQGRTSINISADEVKDLRAHGIDIFVYNEHSAGYMNGGATAAQSYVPGALAVCRNAGLPDGPIFYAVDYDATLGGAPTSATALGNMRALAAFLTEAARISKSWDLVGVYGGYYVIQWLMNNLPLLKHAVQTSAWSGGHWEPRAFCRQDGYNWMINGVNCDHLTVVNPDEGSLRYRTGADDMSQADVDAILAGLRAQLAGVPAAVWNYPVGSAWEDDPAQSAGKALRSAQRYAIYAGHEGTLPGSDTPTLGARLAAGVAGAATAEALKSVASSATAQRAAIAAQLDPGRFAEAFIGKLGGQGGTLTQSQVREAAAAAFAEQLSAVRWGVIDPPAPRAQEEPPA